MFHCFIVCEDHRNFLRFLWHRNNNMDNEIMEYRMKVHVFGNSPSPAVATYGLRRTALDGEKEYGVDARHFVERDFYVDDGLKSLPTDEEAIDLLQRTQGMLSEANLRLHKIASNNSSNQTHIGFLFGKAKLAPKPEHTIRRLELCGAVLAVEIADFMLHELDILINDTKFYTDSKVVLGYIYNQTKRFYVYVSNRVERIRKSSKPEQWHYVPSEINPADHATRPVSTDPETPTILTPATLLTQKPGSIPIPPENFKSGNLCYDLWRRVQHLANCFWNCWKMEYLSTLQGRRKWQRLNPNIKIGDLVLLKDQQAERIDWSMGLIIKSIPSDGASSDEEQQPHSSQEHAETLNALAGILAEIRGLRRQLVYNMRCQGAVFRQIAEHNRLMLDLLIVHVVHSGPAPTSSSSSLDSSLASSAALPAARGGGHHLRRWGPCTKGGRWLPH
ncbi:uncharacterized protein WCC33_000269 [Rhinophrynus dorsalis]